MLTRTSLISTVNIKVLNKDLEDAQILGLYQQNNDFLLSATIKYMQWNMRYLSKKHK